VKKLSKILATISTVTLLSCVWCVDTHAEVKKNGLGVPTHIEAKDDLEFLDNLTEVLNYINSILESEDQTKLDRINQAYTDWKPEEDNIAAQPPGSYNQKEKTEYGFVLKGNNVTQKHAVRYLYQLLRNSKIADKTLPGVWQMYVKYRIVKPCAKYRCDDIVFLLPYDTTTYCVCNQRWRMICLDDKYEVTPTKMTESFKEEVKYNYISSVKLGIVTQTDELPPNTKVYEPQDLQSMTNTDITKLIAVSRLDKIDKNLLKRFLDHSNYFTDFGTFRLNAEINQKLKLKPLGKK